MRFLTFLIVAFIISPAFAGETRQFRDWTAVCDNYRNCSARIAAPGEFPQFIADFELNVQREAYQDNWALHFALRPAQPDENQSVTVEIGADTFILHQPDDIAAYGPVTDFYLVGDAAQKSFEAMQKGDAMKIAFESANGLIARQFSLSGLSASLLWIDEQQNKVNSARTLGEPQYKQKATTREPHPISDALWAMHKAGGECDDLEDLPHKDDLESHRITATTTLHMIPCWAGAYNFSHKFYLETNDGIQPVLFAEYADTLGWGGTATLVNAYFDPGAMTLSAFYKGRGIGDCGSSGYWVWAEWGFKMLEYSYKGDCDGEGEPGDFPVVYQSPEYAAFQTAHAEVD